jgi:hypothetical protein
LTVKLHCLCIILLAVPQQAWRSITQSDTTNTPPPLTNVQRTPVDLKDKWRNMEKAKNSPARNRSDDGEGQGLPKRYSSHFRSKEGGRKKKEPWTEEVCCVDDLHASDIFMRSGVHVVTCAAALSFPRCIKTCLGWLNYVPDANLSPMARGIRRKSKLCRMV